MHSLPTSLESSIYLKQLPSSIDIAFFFLFFFSMEWSPQHAMNAYLNTLHLRKIYDDQVMVESRFDEPKCMEFLSALAAGNGAKLILQVTSEGITPLTLALAVAAKQTGGKLICILPESEHLKRSNIQLITNSDLNDVIELVAGNPIEIIEQFKKIDLILLDYKFADHLELWKSVDVNPKGCLIATINLLHGRKRDSLIQELVKGKYESVTIPGGEGIELTKIRPSKKLDHRRRYRRFHVIYES